MSEPQFAGTLSVGAFKKFPKSYSWPTTPANYSTILTFSYIKIRQEIKNKPTYKSWPQHYNKGIN